MPRYTNAAGVVVDIPAELAERLDGYTPTGDDADAAVVVAGPGVGGGGGGGSASDLNTVGIGGHTLGKWADWLEAEEDYHAMVGTWLEAEQAEADKAAGQPAEATADRRTGRK